MRNEWLYYGGIAGTVLTGICSLTLFFYFKVCKIIGDITGLSARRSIEKIHREGMDQTHLKKAVIHNSTSEIIVKRGKTTAKLNKTQTWPMTNMPDEVLDTTFLTGENETTLLGAGTEDTTVLKDGIYITNEAVVIHTQEYIEGWGRKNQ